MRSSRSGGPFLPFITCCLCQIASLRIGFAEELSRLPKAAAVTTVNKPLLTDSDEIAASHPLAAVIKFARAEKVYLQRHLQSVHCRLVKRERIEGELQKSQFIEMQLQEEIRNGNAIERPMRVFLLFHGPKDVKGRKVLFIEGANKGKMLVRKGGTQFNYAVVRIGPTSENAKRESVVPITDLGFGKLLDRQIEMLQAHARVDPTGKNTEVGHFTDAKINGRACEVIRVVHPQQQQGLTFHKANVYIDSDLHVPVRIDASDWPTEPGGECPLLAEYTYTDMQLNVDFPEATFDEDRLKEK